MKEKLEEIKILMESNNGSIITIHSEDNNNSNKYLNLGIIDFSMVEERGHVFLYIVSLLNDIVTKKLDKTDTDNGFLRRKEWQDMLHKLAGGMPLLDVDNLYSEDSFQDPEFIMNKQLRNIRSATNLKSNIDRLIDFVLKLMECSKILICFEGLQFAAHLWIPLIETIRKYFISNKMDIIMNLDMKLLSTLLKNHQYKYRGIEINSNFEDNYFQKIFNLKSRIKLD